MITKNDIFEHEAGTFLCDLLPDKWDELEDQELFDFMEKNAWYPFEGWEGKDIFNVIDTASESTLNFLKATGIKISE